MASNFFAMYRSERSLTFKRGSGRGALFVSAVVGVVSVFAMLWIQNNSSGAEINGNPAASIFEFSGPNCAGWALFIRNFFVLPLLLLLATGSTVVGEIQDQTLREILIRPNSRRQVLAAKFLALVTLSFCSLLCSLIPSLIIGCAFFGASGPWDVILGYAASLGSDIGIIAIGMLASTFVRSVGGVIVSVILLLAADGGARLLLFLTGKARALFSFVETGEATPAGPGLSGLLPGAALEGWKGWNDVWHWEPFVGLIMVVGICLTSAIVRFQRMDIP